MPATTEKQTDKKDFETLRKKLHKNCCVCSPANSAGLRMQLETLSDGRLKGTFDCGEEYQGYDGMIQGGVVASLLDGIMTNHLFAQNVVAVTAELNVRYRHPVQIGITAELFAEIDKQHSDLYLMKAKLFQADKLHATATAKFLAQPQMAIASQK